MKRLVFLIFFFLVVTSLSATTWYVRPAGGTYGNEDGTSYANAWDGLLNVTWGVGGVVAGDEIYICGTHIYNLTQQRSDQGDFIVSNGTNDATRVTIRGDYGGDAGILWSAYYPTYDSWTDEGSNTYSIGLPGDSYNGMIFEDISGDTGTLLTEASDLTDCKATSGTFWSTDYEGNSTIYVHRGDDAAPNDDVYLNCWGYRLLIAASGGYITFANMTFCNFYKWRDSFDSGDNVTHITFDTCTFKYGEGPLFQTDDSGSGYIIFDTCTIEYGLEGIALNGGASNNTIKDCTIRYCGYLAEHQGGLDPHGIGLQGGSSNNLIENNEIYECEDGIVFYAYDGETAENNIIRYNYVHDLHGLGGSSVGSPIAFGSPAGDVTLAGITGGNQIYGNILCDGEDGIYYKWPDEVQIYNNVFYNNGNTIETKTTQSDAVGTDIVFKNNISLSPTGYHIYYDARNGQVGDSDFLVTSDSNCFYPDDGNYFYFNDGDGAATTTNFTGWKALSRTGCTFDPNSITDDPAFVNAGGSHDLDTDFQIPTGSPCKDAGVNVGIGYDYAGIQIPQGDAPDIGAYEYDQGVHPHKAILKSGTKLILGTGVKWIIKLP